MQSTVLVVDDDPAIRNILAEVFALEGYSVQTAEHGGPALDILRTSPVPLIVTLGLIMPEVDGIAVLEAVAADEALARRHAIVVLTGAVGLASEGRVKELRDQLGIPLVGKPFTVDQLLDSVADAAARLAQ